MEKIDILLPYYGDFSLFKQTIDSVIKQTSDKWVLKIFDDHYPSLEAKRYCESLKNNKISYFRHQKNIGITNNFNYAIKHASNRYCMLPGSDDMLLPNYVETALTNIKDNDFYQPGVEVIDINNKVYLPLGDRAKRILRPKKSGIYRGENLATSLCNGNWLYFPSITWKTSTIRKYGFNADYKIVEDLILELNIIKDGGTLFFDKTNTFQYRRFAGSLSSKEKHGIRFHEEDLIYSEYSKIFKEIGWKKASRSAKLKITSRIDKLINSV